MTRFVRMFRYDPVKDPRARLRIDYHPDFGNAVLSDENVNLKQVDNPDARHVEVLASLQLTAPMVRWIAEAAAELATIMEDNDRQVQAELDIRRRERLTMAGFRPDEPNLNKGD